MEPVIVSILMPAYNAERFIGPAIESVLSQSFSGWELIIVNDGSGDRTREIVEQYTDARIKVFHQENGGESSARNAALQHVQGELIAFLDADDCYLEDHLELTVSYLQAHSDLDGVYTDGFYINEKGNRLKPLSSRRRGPFEGDIFEEMVRASDVFGAPVCVVLRHAVVCRDKLAFDPEIVIGPDWDFLTRCSQSARFGRIDRCTCLYRVHPTNISIRTNLQKRALSLARCREKAIQMARFKDCSIEIRAFVFYDLLINLLTGFPERQDAITQWDEFRRLPAPERARLFRLMASKALLRGDVSTYVGAWLQGSRKLNPSDWRGYLLNTLFKISPTLCKQLLTVKTSSQEEALPTFPYGNLE